MYLDSETIFIILCLYNIKMDLIKKKQWRNERMNVKFCNSKSS